MPTCDLYLRLSDARIEEALDGREAKLRAYADVLGWIVFRVVIENDRYPDGRLKPATAYKRRKVKTPSGKTEMRVIRPGFREVLDDLESGRINALLGEDLDRIVRDPRDMEDLLDSCTINNASVRSLSGSLKITNGGDENEKYVARIMVAGASKSSGDTSRRVKDDRERRLGESYQGGPRPYGFAHAKNTEKYHRTLIPIDDESEVLNLVCDNILDRGISLAAEARRLRQEGVPTTNGKADWSSALLKRVLLKPAVAGVAVNNGNLKPAPWPAIISRERWERLVAKLTDPDRRTSNRGNEPTWLISGIGLCGVCRDGMTVRATGRHDTTFYACRGPVAHLKRRARPTDAFVERVIVAYLDKYGRHILKPPVKKDIDTTALHAEKTRLYRAKAAQMSLHTAGEIDDDDLKRGMRDIRDRLAVVEAQLARCYETDPLIEFRDKPAEAAWKSLSLPRKRAIIKLIAEVTIKPSALRGRAGFDPDSIDITFRAKPLVDVP